MNKQLVTLVVSLAISVAAGQVHAAANNASEIKTSTVGGISKLASPFFYFGKVSVASPDAPKFAEELASSFAKSGYKVVEDKSKPTYVIIRDFRGKAADYVPQTADTRTGGGWASALFTLGINLLVGEKLGLINTSNVLQSNSVTLADTIEKTGRAYSEGNPSQNEGRAKAAEKAKEEATNLVVYRLCTGGNCAYALAAGDADLDQLDEACFRKGILKLAGQEE